MLKRFLILGLLISGLLFSPVAIDAKSNLTLRACYKELNKPFGSVLQRASDAAAFGIWKYKGTAEQNTKLSQELCGNSELLGAFSVATGYEKNLRVSITASQDYIPVTSLVLKDGTTLDMSKLGSKVFLTIEPGTSREEISMCTNISTTSINFTSCTRGLAFSGTSTAAVTANQKTHSAGSKVVMSNVHFVYEQFVDTNDKTQTIQGDKTATGTWTFTATTSFSGQLPTSVTSTPTLPGQLITLEYLTTVSSTGCANASETVRGCSELATGAEAAAGTSAGGTGSRLVVPASIVSSTPVATNMLPATNAAGKIHNDFLNGNVASGIATLDTNTLVVQNPANATSTPAANKIVQATASTTIADGWINTSTLAGTISTIQNFTSGEAINASAAPVAVYFSNNDNLVHPLTSATASTTIFDFVGFVILGQNVSGGVTVKVQTAGLVNGFSGLTTSSYYYGTDSAGVVSSTAGTISYQVAVATTNSQLLIKRGKKVYNGTTSFSATASLVVDIGFKPSRVRVEATMATNEAHSNGGWSVNGGNNCVYVENAPASGADTNAWHVQAVNAGTSHLGTVTTLTNRGFTLSNTKAGSPGNVSIFWEAEE